MAPLTPSGLWIWIHLNPFRASMIFWPWICSVYFLVLSILKMTLLFKEGRTKDHLYTYPATFSTFKMTTVFINDRDIYSIFILFWKEFGRDFCHFEHFIIWHILIGLHYAFIFNVANHLQVFGKIFFKIWTK